MNIYVGNLSFGATEDDVRKIFVAYGQVSSVAIIKDKMTGKSRGFAFVEMPNDSEAQSAISALNGKEIGGRTLTVNEARPRPEGSSGPRGGSRGGTGGYGGSRGGGGSYGGSRSSGSGGKGGRTSGGSRNDW